MRLIYTTSDRSFWERARLELHGEGIETFESEIDPAISSLGSPFMQRDYRLYILHGEDLARANEILLKIGAAPTDPIHFPTGWWVRVVILLTALGMVAIATM